jgi:hypothetical protein
VDDGENPEPNEPQLVILWRYEQARLYGLSRIEAELFAVSDADMGEMRHLEALGCAPATAARILL